MELFCPRCHTSLSTQARFCPECGAPQLTVETVRPETENEVVEGSYLHAGPSITWRAAIGSAALLSLPAGLLSSLLSFSTLWVLAGGAWTVMLYRRRTAGQMSAALGSRIGSVFGIFAAVVATFVDACNLLFSRYTLHRGGQIDTRLHSAMQTGIDRVLASNPDAAREIPWFFHFWLSGDGQAALVLASAALSATSMLGFSALGGAIGARYFGSQRS